MTPRTTYFFSQLQFVLLVHDLSPSRAFAQLCQQLSEEACASTCVPFNAGMPSQVDFSCGDFWLSERCCNGSKSQTVVTTDFFECSCQTIGMTRAGLGVILVLVFLAFAALLTATLYVLYRKKKRIEAEAEERVKAIEEAQVYLPR